MTTELKTFNFEITSLDQAMQYAKLIADSDLAPKDYRGKPGNVLIAIQYGIEIGLKPMQAIQNIAVINGRPTIWGDAMLAIVQNHPLCEYIKEDYKNNTAYCSVKRRGEEEYTYEFSKEDAKQAGLLGKAGVWQQYPERMLQMRARGFALRDKFSDVLKGIAMREEVQDYVVEIKQDKKENAEKLDLLIENKKKAIPLPVMIEEVRCKISHSVTLEELGKAAELAKGLPEKDRDDARILYKSKYNELINAQTKEIVTDDKKQT